MTKQRSPHRAPVKTRASRKTATGANSGVGMDRELPVSGKLARAEDTAEHAELARKLVLKSWTGIVQGLIKKAKTGGYQQTKLLLDLCELTKGGSELSGQHKRQLCDALLEGLGWSPTELQEQADDSEATPAAEATKGFEQVS